MTGRLVATRRLVPIAVAWCATAAPLGAQRIRLPASLEELEQRARKDSNDAAAHFNVALAYWNAKRWDDAERALQTAVTIEPQFAEAYIALGRLPFARRPRLWDDIYERDVPSTERPALERAYRMYDRALLIDPFVDLRIEAAARPARSVYWTATEFLNQLYDYLFGGFEDIEAGRYDAAYNRFDRYVQDAPTRVDREAIPSFIYYFRGLAAAHIQRWPEAIRDFELLLDRAERKLSPDSLVYELPLETNHFRYVLAVLHQRSGDLEQAVQLYRTAIENDIGLYMAHARLATIAESEGRWPEAVEERQRAYNANPDDASLLADLGKTLVRARRLPDAEDALRRAAEANPRDTRSLYYLGIVEQQLAKTAEARDAFTRFLALAPSRYVPQIADAKQRLSALH